MVTMTAMVRGGRYIALFDESWLICLGILCSILIAILAAGRGPDREAILTALLAVEANNSSLQRDVGRARTGQASNHDPLIQSIASLHNLLAELKELSSKADMENDRDWSSLLASLICTVNRDDAIVRELEKKNTLLEVSLDNYSKTLGELDRNGNPENRRTLRNLMAQFLVRPQEYLAGQIENQINVLLKSKEAPVSQLQALAAHTHVILDTVPQVEGIVSSVQASQASSRAQELAREYLEVSDRQTNLRSYWSRTFLECISIILCGYVSVLIYRLRFQTRRLARRLEFEQTVKDVKALFTADVMNDISGTLHEALNVLAIFFNAGHCQLVFIDVESSEIDETFEGGATQNSPTRRLALKTILELYRDSFLAGAQHELLFYRNLQSQQDLAFTRDATSAGGVIGMQISPRRGAMLVFEYSEARKKTHGDEIDLMGAAIELLIQCVDHDRKRQEREILEQRLEHAERLQAVGTLAGGIAHEFNNILAAMLGYGEMALQVLRRPSRAKNYVQGIVSAGERAQHIIDQILTLSRKCERNSKPFDVVEVVSDILPVLMVSFPETSELRARLAEEKTVILGNPVEIQQILMNLCKNALEASPGDAKVEIEVTLVDIKSRKLLSHGKLQPGSYVLLSVTDQGAGIPESVLPHIFEPFFTTKSHAGGTGLGLAAVHGNAAALTGEINVVSNVGLGTHFELFFPVCHQPATPLRDFFNEPLVPLGSGQTIVVLEMDAALLTMHEEKIAALGYEPVGFSSLDRVVEWLATGQNLPDLFVIDVASFETSRTLSEISSVVGDVPYLLAVNPSWDVYMRKQSFRQMEVLRKPISTANMASTIYKKLNSDPDAMNLYRRPNV